ncbi:tetratricopeptide repeat protein [Frigoribacterium sp. CG_9.8]|uniref:tetratricopeptide repeat protein n=1 Tax=Frigoribacterium sp. CG_9.8 TaxID=2787733 RepID=UPI0018C965BB|nr:tetratricopeptide repeat protein [Frigoribacterium sp. CG_9.8]MBG6107766.1 tetratricopeptide (TPR) repeat protein [Frigoribacterium sp. CG_9.8]
MKSRIAALSMSALLVLYLVLVLQLAIRLIAVDNGIAKTLGIALLVLPLLGAWALAAELLFGIRTQKLVSRLDAAGELPVDSLPKRTSGRPERAAADAEFPHYKAAVEADPGSWQAWFRLGLSYDASGDRSRARRAIRRAISLERAAR